MGFRSIPLQRGRYGTTRLLQAATVARQRQDGFGAATTVASSPAGVARGPAHHYGLGNWRETAAGTGPTPSNPVTRWSSTSAFGRAPWVAVEGSYAAVIMTRQPSQVDSGSIPSKTPRRNSTR